MSLSCRFSYQNVVPYLISHMPAICPAYTCLWSSMNNMSTNYEIHFMQFAPLFLFLFIFSYVQIFSSSLCSQTPRIFIFIYFEMPRFIALQINSNMIIFTPGLNWVIPLLFSTYALQALRLIVRSGLDVPTFATRRLHACHHARAPSGWR